jgi:hypothetical protein
MGTIRTWEMFSGHTRLAWAGQVTISDNKVDFTHTVAAQNPRTVMGIVVPVTTTGRPSAPTPLSGDITGKAMGTDKGHLMALELGGPDISENIAPQSNRWQQTGGWRKIETNACTLVKQWMGVTSSYKPGSKIPAPNVGGFFRVGPYPETDPITGEPKAYTGSITKIIINAEGSGIYWPHYDQETHIFYISPGEVWWQSGQKKWQL